MKNVTINLTGSLGGNSYRDTYEALQKLKDACEQIAKEYRGMDLWIYENER